THPANQTQISGNVLFEGFAFAGRREITSVELRFDSGEWIPAQLSPRTSEGEWIRWQLQWQPENPGKYSIEVRATDASGFRKFEAVRDLFSHARPNGVSAIHQITLEVITV